MKVLIVGSGGREHAVARAFAQTEGLGEIFVAPGNDGIAETFACLPLRSNSEILDWCRLERPEIVFIGPEKPLAEGLADSLRSAGIACVGPSQAAARIETSKIWAKTLMAQNQVPTAEFAVFGSWDDAEDYLRGWQKYPVVIKVDSLAAGKGVRIAPDPISALQAINDFRSEFPSAGAVIEEYLTGWEASLFAITDGNDFITTIFAQDHKQLLDGDEGPNTGGMGAFCPVAAAEPYRKEIEQKIIKPVLDAMHREGCPFSGILYCGLIITKDGPKVLEFNCRLGDPETQALLPLLKTPIIEICQAITQNRVNALSLKWHEGYSICVVLASEGYPGEIVTGRPIRIPDQMISSVCFSGVKKTAGELVTAGGRVLTLAARGLTLESARKLVYHDAALVDFDGKHFRNDVSLRSNTL